MADTASLGTVAWNAESDDYKSTVGRLKNGSAPQKNFREATQKLKKQTGIPTAIQSIGAQNYQKILQQLSSWFGGAASA